MCSSGNLALASTETVQEQEPRYKVATAPSERVFSKLRQSRDELLTNMTFGYAHGVDTNPLLDSTHKADNYEQESLDLGFRYPMAKSGLGRTDIKFGAGATNINYYEITDVNTFDGTAYASLEQGIGKDLLAAVGYGFELLWFPNSPNGNYIGNEVNISLRQKLLDWMYQKLSYRYIFRGYMDRKVVISNGTQGSDLRQDSRNVLEHEFGMYLADSAKIKITNQFYWNNSNFQYLNYYDYFNYRVTAGIVQFFTKKLYHITGFSYQRRNYYYRTVSVGDYDQRDNLWTVSATLSYDLTRQASLFANYSHMENHSNEPTERYTDNLYTFGLYYAF